jgi:hypothetical protein
VIARLDPQPQFICFPGDEISGLVADDQALRRQWGYWLTHEMAWLDSQAIPIYHTTGNHTTYDATSESVFREMLDYLPRNGPAGQEGLTYFVRRGDLLLVFVHTLWTGLGGEGHVETEWLEKTLARHADARHKLVLGHHPVFPVNGFSGAYQRDIGPEHAQEFWQVLVRHRVLAYICSHILAFDVQVHDGVLQILTAGAGTAHRMPEGIEYLHAMQAALDSHGLRYQVLDTDGRVREWLSWPLSMPLSKSWAILDSGEIAAPIQGSSAAKPSEALLIAWHFSGVCPASASGEPQTLICGWDPGPALESFWIGLSGREQRLTILLAPEPGRSPHLWRGPQLTPGKPFSIQLACHTGMGPGGLMWRWEDGRPWSSFLAASPWGAERVAWPARWSLGHDKRGRGHRPFRGQKLGVSWHCRTLELQQ